MLMVTELSFLTERLLSAHTSLPPSPNPPAREGESGRKDKSPTGCGSGGHDTLDKKGELRKMAMFNHPVSLVQDKKLELLQCTQVVVFLLRGGGNKGRERKGERVRMWRVLNGG